MALAIAGLVGVLAGCGSDEDDHDHDMHDHHHNDAGGDATHELDESREKATQAGNFFVSYTPTPDPIPFNELFELQVDVWESDAKETRVSDAEVDIEVTMPAHGHGMNTEPSVTSQEDGSFLVEGMKFHMQSNSAAERWELAVTVDQNGTSDTAVFEVMCCQE